MSLVRLLGFRTLTCGCVVGRYRELATSREISYVEEKGGDCAVHVHRRNHTIPDRVAPLLANVAARLAADESYSHDEAPRYNHRGVATPRTTHPTDNR